MSVMNTGKKVFFVYPNSVITKELIDQLMDLEYEVYLLNDHREINKICKECAEPIFLINIDKILKDYEWEDYIHYLMNNSDTKHAQIGVLTFNQDDNLSKRYLMDLMITCGFVKLKLDVIESKEIIIKMLKANEAKGKRLYLGTSCYRSDAFFNAIIEDSIQHGEILNISSIGMVFTFYNNTRLHKGIVSDVQLKLKGILLKVSLEIINIKKDKYNNTIYIARFTNNTDDISKFKIKSYISRTLQFCMEDRLNLQFMKLVN